ncbi:MAG: ABC transporter ATP-binding protein [Rhodobacteraceae bacterium]|nr:ABC transporter ATP-binding protein [Paracoccaceae bacterium]
MSQIKLTKVNKYFDGTHVVKDVSLFIPKGSFTVMVGPSGCGKSTILRMIAGLEDLDAGEVEIDGAVVNEVRSKDRDLAMVFQSYALFPHMTVFENMAFGLTLNKRPKIEIKERVLEAAKILKIEELLQRKPKQLSGGQKQRVAIGRAITRRPKVFLFDEPLSNLDASLRVQMRFELAKLHKYLNATILYVTHDQTEAMTLADQIILLNDGSVAQIGEPLNLYNKPKNKFVGSFIGSPKMNFIDASVESMSGKVVKLRALNIIDPISYEAEEEFNIGEQLTLGIRPENLIINDKADCFWKSSVELVEKLGAESLVYLSRGESPLIAQVNGQTDIKVGDKVSVGFDVSSSSIFKI